MKRVSPHVGSCRMTLRVLWASALAALPLITAGFYSKDLILWQAWSLPRGSPVLWAAGWFGALLTGAYIFRVVFIAFFGAARIEPGARRLDLDRGVGTNQGAG